MIDTICCGEGTKSQKREFFTLAFFLRNHHGLTANTESSSPAAAGPLSGQSLYESASKNDVSRRED